MADYSTLIESMLESSIPLAALATGGIYSTDTIGRLGITRANLPGAFTNGLIKPTIVVRERSSTPTGEITDEANQVISMRTVVEIWLYQDTGYATIQSMKQLVYNLLQDKFITNGRGRANLVWEVKNQRDTTIDASVERMDFEILHLRTAQ